MPVCVRDVILINVVYEDHQLFMNQHLFNLTVTCIEDDTERCLVCMFQSEVSGHRLQSCYIMMASAEKLAREKFKQSCS